MPNHCLSSENVDIYFGLWRASFKCLATAKDTELVGKFQPQYAAWWPINFALICSFLIGIGVLFAGLVRCLVEELGLMITFWSARGTNLSPPRHNKCASPWAGLIRKLFFRIGRFPAWKCNIVRGNELALLHRRQMGILSHTKKLIVWNETCYRMLLLPLTTLCRISLDEIPGALWRITQGWDVAHGCHEPLW